MLTLTEVMERLKDIDEVELLEALGITSEDLVDRFSDVIEDKLEKIQTLVDWEQ
jgi:hypothetical protein